MESKNSKIPTEIYNSKCQSYPRIGHRCILLGSQLLVFGGTNYHADFVSIVLKINCLNLRCQVLPTTNSLPLEGFSLFSYQGRVFLWGGSKPSNMTNQLWEFGDSKYVSKKQQGSVPSPRAYHASSLCLQRYLVVNGGFDQRGFFNDWYILDCQNFHWRKLIPSLQIPICYGSKIIWAAGQGILYTGSSFNSATKTASYNNQWYTFTLKDLKTSHPKLLLKNLDISEGIMPSGRSLACLCSLNENVILIGGQRIQMNKVELCDDMWILNMETLTWSRQQVNLKTKYGFEECFYKNKLLLIGGVINANQFSSQIQVLDLDKNISQYDKLCRICTNTLTSLYPLNSSNPPFILHLKQPSKKCNLTVPLLASIAQYIDNPINAFGLLVDNSFNMSATSISISIKQTSKISYIAYGDNSSAFTLSDIKECVYCMNWKTGTTSPDKKIDQQCGIWTQYGINLKFAGLRIGKQFFYVTKTIDNQIFCAYFSSQKQNVYEYYLDSKGNVFGEQNRNIIGCLILKKELNEDFEDISSFSTKIYIFECEEFKTQDNKINFGEKNLITFLKKQYLIPYIGRTIMVNQNLVIFDNLPEVLRQKQIKNSLKQIQLTNVQHLFKKVALYQYTDSIDHYFSQVYIYHQNRFIQSIYTQNNTICGFIEIPDLIEINIFKQRIVSKKLQNKIIDFIKKIQNKKKELNRPKHQEHTSIEQLSQQPRKYPKLNHF